MLLTHLHLLSHHLKPSNVSNTLPVSMSSDFDSVFMTLSQLTLSLPIHHSPTNNHHHQQKLSQIKSPGPKLDNYITSNQNTRHKT